jgi:hypothetical protein
MRTTVAIENSRGDASPVHQWIGSSPQWSFPFPDNAPSIARFFVPNNRNRLAIFGVADRNTDQ